MRIQHNIMAMNAYRNYNTNTKALSGNLEKLSSGYKINRAGDDAAGLAISEKMRAQITGLDAAQKNVKDGISLVKTAEGAMQEIQDMLNRMDYLATQSANGTYDNPVDRANLQKEVENLKTEINRIADSANFNGIKLLDGSQDPGATKAVAAKTEQLAAEKLTIEAVGTDHDATGSVLHTDGVDYQAPSFTIDLTDVEFASKGTAGFTVSIASKNYTVATKAATGAVADGDVVKGDDLAAAIAAAINATDTTIKGKNAAGADSAVLQGAEVGGLVYKATADGSTITFALQTTDKGGTANITQDHLLPTDGSASIPQSVVSITATAANGTLSGLDAGGHAPTEIVYGQAEKTGGMACGTVKLTDGQINDGTKITIGDQTFVFSIGKDSTVTAGTGETLIDMKAVTADDNQKVDKAIALMTQNSGSWFRLESNASGFLTAVETADYDGEGDLTTTEGLQSNFSISQMKVTAAVAANAGDTSKGITLQIGDTSDAFNQMKITIGDMHVDAMGKGKLNEGTDDEKDVTLSIKDIDIGTQAGAQAAIDSIKNAINYVSGIRGDLGAAQNRLEHTGNNLSVMAENIQDAESTIRDTDVANEMMSYVKNNILVQSAQAMLAQANQVPQGVLQLLG